MSDKFPRQNYFGPKKLGTAWRRAKGRQSKTRLYKKGKLRQPKPGFGTERSKRFSINGLHPIIIKNENDFSKITQGRIAVLSSTLGLKKIVELSSIAKEKKIKILNNSKVLKAEKAVASKKKKKELAKKQEEEKRRKEATEKAKEVVKKEIKEELGKTVEKPDSAEKLKAEKISKEAEKKEKKPKKDNVEGLSSKPGDLKGTE